MWSGFGFGVLATFGAKVSTDLRRQNPTLLELLEIQDVSASMR